MAENDRLYQLHLGSRPAYWGDLGNRLQISGFVLQGEDCTAIVLSPNASPIASRGDINSVLQPTVAEWWDMIRQTDDPAVFELDATGGIKAVHRKMQRAISGIVQQKIWARDSFCCMYCGAGMGDVSLSVDHFVPIEHGGQDNERNYLSACRRCNKMKGSKKPADWCAEIGKSLEGYEKYLKHVHSVA